MKRHEPYSDPNAADQFLASQIQQHMYPQRTQHIATMKNYPERTDSFTADNEHMYRSSKGEGHWQRDRDAQKISNHTPSHLLSQGQGGNGTRSFHQGQMVDPKPDIKKQEHKDARVQVQEEDMEIGYEDNPLPLTYEGIEQKFLNEITKLVKEQSDAEDAENARHGKKMIEINTQYQEKLLLLRNRQANRRDEFLHKESQARLLQYQQSGRSHYSNSPAPGPGSGELHEYSRNVSGEAHRGYAGSQFESYRERPQYPGTGRAQSTEGRIPYPSGRVYNAGSVHYPDIH